MKLHQNPRGGADYEVAGSLARQNWYLLLEGLAFDLNLSGSRRISTTLDIGPPSTARVDHFM